MNFCCFYKNQISCTSNYFSVYFIFFAFVESFLDILFMLLFFVSARE